MRAELARAVGELDLEQQTKILRAFTLFFQLANLAEQQHRVRRRRDVEREDGVAARVARRSVRGACGRAGSATRRWRAAAEHVSLELVLTAHPTEATRRTILQAQARARRAAGRARRRRGRSPSAPPRRSPSSGRRTRCARSARASSTRSATASGSSSTASSTPPRSCSRLPRAHPRRAAAALLRKLDRRATWTATRPPGPDTIREALDRGRALALARYRSEARELAAALGLTTTLVGVSEELLESIARDERELPEYAEGIGEQNSDEPYRRKLSFIWWRLGNDGYARVEELAADLDVIDRSLRAHARRTRIADGRLASLRRRVELFGFHVAKLDVRFHADELRRGDAARARRRSRAVA